MNIDIVHNSLGHYTIGLGLPVLGLLDYSGLQ